MLTPLNRGGALVGSILAIAVIATTACTGPEAEPRATGTVGAPSAPMTPSPSPVLWNVDAVDVATGRATPLPRTVRSIMGAANFRTSPDGERLAFDDGAHIYVGDMRGTWVGAITHDEVAEGPSWSPDGTRIVYSSGDGALAVVDVATGDTTRVAFGHDVIYHPNFSADGRAIVFTRIHRQSMHLWVVPAAGGRATPLPIRRAAFGSYSPTSPTIAYRRTDWDGSDVTEMTEGAIWLTDAEGTYQRQLTHSYSSMSQVDPTTLWPMWSPDGRRIAFEPLYGRGVKVVDVATGVVTWIGHGKRPSWLDNDTLIIEKYEPLNAG